MDIEQLINSTDVSNPDQVRVLQNALKAQGLYNGPIDGQFGGGTTSAVNTFRENKAKADALRMQQLQLETQQRQAEAQRIQAEAEKAKQDPTNQTISTLRQYGPLAGGAAFGAGAGLLYNRAVKAGDVQRTKQINQIATMKDMHPEAAKDALKDIDRSSTKMKRAGVGYIPLGMLALSGFTRLAGNQFPEDSDMREFLNIAGTGSQAGAGVFATTNAPSWAGGPNPDAAVDRARINSDYRGYLDKRKTEIPAETEIKPDDKIESLKNSMTKEQLKAQAQRFKLTVRSRHNKYDLAKMIVESGKKMPGKALKSLPWVAGGLAAGLTAADQASAADLEPLEQAGLGLGVGAGVGAGAYGLMKGGEKLAQKIGQYGLGRAALRAVPGGFGALAAYDTVNAWPLSTKQDMEAMAGITSQPMSHEEAGLADYLMKKQLQDQQIQSMTHGPNQIGHY